MCGGGLSKLPEDITLRGVIAKEKDGFVFHWERFYNLNSVKIDILLKKIPENEVPNMFWFGTKKNLVNKIKLLNSLHGLPGVIAAKTNNVI